MDRSMHARGAEQLLSTVYYHTLLRRVHQQAAARVHREQPDPVLHHCC
jgi:hypothetical protein